MKYTHQKEAEALKLRARIDYLEAENAIRVQAKKNLGKALARVANPSNAARRSQPSRLLKPPSRFNGQQSQTRAGPSVSRYRSVAKYQQQQQQQQQQQHLQGRGQEQEQEQEQEQRPPFPEGIAEAASSESSPRTADKEKLALYLEYLHL